MICEAMPTEDSTNNNRIISTKQKLDPISDETEPEAKRVRYNMKENKNQCLRNLYFDLLSRSEVSSTTNNFNGNENNDNETRIAQNANERLTNIKEFPCETETKAAKQRELIPYETRIKQFREMLAEKQVKPFRFYS